MKKIIITSIMASTISSLAFAATAEVFTVEKLNQLNKLHDVQLSPNAKQVVYGVKNPTTGDNHLYLQNLADGKVQQLTTHAKGEGNVLFNKTGDALYFLSSRSGSAQVWQLSLTGGEAKQITDLPLPVEGFTLASDNKTLALAITVKPECEDFACTLEAMAQDKQQKAKVRTYDQLMVRHWDTWLTPYKQHLFVVKLDGKLVTTAKDLMTNWHSDIAGINEVTISPDGAQLVFSAKADSKDQAWSTNFDLFSVDLSSYQITNLTQDNKAWDASPVYSHNGRYLAYKAMKTPGYESDKFSLMLRDNVTGKVKAVTDSWDRSVSELVFTADDRNLLVTAQDVGQKSIFVVNPEFGDVRRLYNIGTNSSLSTAADTVSFVRHSLNTPKDIFTMNTEGYEVKQITNINQDKLKDISFAEYQQFSFNGANNEQVHGYWLKPANFEAGKKYPIAFLVHGGPQGSFGNMFHYRWNAQLWAAQGYGVVMIDFHGSTGYGQAFTDSIARDWGGKPLEDLQKGLAYITEQQPWLDGNNACALGASYGGYMMNWIQGNWSTQFKCIVNHAGLFDMPSFYLTTEELWFPEHDLGGPVWDKSEDYQKFNPSAYVNKWQTPMLVIQGERDYRVPYGQSLGAFTTLQRKGIDSRLVVFPDENHHIKNPDNLVRWYHEVFDWLNKYTQSKQEKAAQE